MGDEAAIHAVNAQAFPTDAEARLVGALRTQAHEFLSLVAESGDEVVGHIAFSPVTLDGRNVPVLGLAPMAVRPDLQRQGIGSALVRAGLAACREAGVDAVVVLGHPDFYPRFGFRPASTFGLRCEYEVPDEVYMALELAPGSLSSCAGVVRYHAAFSALG
jgi:putative acetyltransferase